MASLYDKFLNKLNFIDGTNKTIKFTCFKSQDKKFKSYWKKLDFSFSVPNVQKIQLKRGK